MNIDKMMAGNCMQCGRSFEVTEEYQNNHICKECLPKLNTLGGGNKNKIKYKRGHSYLIENNTKLNVFGDNLTMEMQVIYQSDKATCFQIWETKEEIWILNEQLKEPIEDLGVDFNQN